MKRVFSKIPLHPFLVAFYPVLALYAINIKEVAILVILRPILVSLLIALVLMTFLRLLLRDWLKAASVSSLILLLFFSYGHLYQFLKTIGNAEFARHRYLLVIYLLIFMIFLWITLKKVRNYSGLTLSLNILGLLLLIFPSIQIISFQSSLTSVSNIIQNDQSDQKLSFNGSDILPDIYYIVLDTYTRADALEQDFGFDNTPFLNELRQMGFYVADCSRSNYSYTEASLVSTLNLDYIPSLFSSLEDQGLDDDNVWVLIKQSLVRQKLESMGYQTVAFQTGYEWSHIADADIILSLGNVSANSQVIKPFETMLIRSTALILLDDTQKKVAYQSLGITNHPFADHISLQSYILEQLPRIPLIPGPKFIFVHILIPHVPYVFNPQGEILADPGYFSAKNSMAVNEDYLRRGYVGEVEFINTQMIQIFSQILEKSITQPIIVIHGDHGVRDDNRLKILNAYYMPQERYELFYPSISPVNSFRVVFDTVFGTDYGLLPDRSYLTDDISGPSPETSPACLIGRSD